ncbi:hypothetical protein AB1Y20_004553 [Prymnesium parvum]|uniref:UBA domain-containing protein n=1 Tax=Prymnesium parvum TaxID=97485 RepID=A0AB34IX26_PRYPA
MSLADMVLRCEKTGKLLFSEAEAKQHGDDTGLQEFAQVSLEEKVWECEETKKVCFNETQMDLHKRRVPEAVTWVEKTVGDLQRAWKEKNSTPAAGVEVETEEDMLLRAAGKAPKSKGKGPAQPEGPPTVTKELVDQLMEMGFSELRAQKALVKTSNTGIEPAVNWLSEHLEDEDIDEPMEVVSKTQEEMGEEMAKALADGGSQLSAEEKKLKLEEALAKARAKKSGLTVEEEKQKERARREGGKTITATKREFEDQQRQRDIEARKREKREFELERAKLREKLAKDREEKIKQGLIVPTAAAPAAPAAAEPPKPAEPAKPKTAREGEAEAAIAALAGAKRSFDEPELSLDEAQRKLCEQLDTKIQPFLSLFPKLADNIAKNPTDPKYRKVRLTNAKLAEGLVHVAGARQFLRAIGWQLVEGEYLQLPLEVDAASQVKAIADLAAMAAAAQEQRRVDELNARKKEIADKAAKAKAEKEAIKAQMAKDRGEVLARGLAEASKAKALPTGQGTTGRVQQEE